MNQPSTLKQTLIYSLYCGGLYGTERMAVSTLTGLPANFEKILICPPGEASKTAKQLGISTYTFRDKRQFICSAINLFLQKNNFIIISCSVSQSVIFSILSILFFKKINHFHIVHGGADEINSYQKKRILCFFNIKFIAVSNFVKSKLINYGVNAQRISVIENFISNDMDKFTKHSIQWPPERIVLVSRLDPVKRLDLLISLLHKYPEFNKLSFTIYGTGGSISEYQSYAKQHNLNISYAGYCSDIVAEISKYDLFLHLCPDEPFGLVILESMLAGTPVLTPNSGGPKDIIKHLETGIVYQNSDIDDLAEQLLNLSTINNSKIQSIISNAQDELKEKYLTNAGILRYINLINNGRAIN